MGAAIQCITQNFHVLITRKEEENQGGALCLKVVTFTQCEAADFEDIAHTQHSLV